MASVILFLKFFHFLGFASLLGGLLAQMKEKTKRVSPAMLHGAITQLVTGLLLVGALEPGVNHAKVGVKFLILIAILGTLVWYRKTAMSKNVFLTVLCLTIFEVAVAVFIR